MEVIASQSLKSYHVACSIKYITFYKILINPICRYLYLRSSYWRVTSPNFVKTTIIKILWFVFLFISYFSPVSFFLLSRNPYCCIRTSLQTHSVERSSGRANSIPRILHRSNKGGSDASYESVTLGRDTGHGITERATRKQTDDKRISRAPSLSIAFHHTAPIYVRLTRRKCSRQGDSQGIVYYSRLKIHTAPVNNLLSRRLRIDFSVYDITLR